jgi:hypothetical protein
MQELLVRDDKDTFNVIQVLVTKDMVKDINNLDFGFNRDPSYSTCHLGVLPFMVIPLLMAQASQRQRAVD